MVGAFSISSALFLVELAERRSAHFLCHELCQVCIIQHTLVKLLNVPYLDTVVHPYESHYATVDVTSLSHFSG